MIARLFFFLFALVTFLLPEAAWAGSGGPKDYAFLTVIVVLILVIIGMLRTIMKKFK